MAKEAIKTEQRERQRNLCALTGKPLPPNLSLFDTDRKIPRAKGGRYTKGNYAVVDPIAHLERHGNLRERVEIFRDLKSALDERRQQLKLRNKINNQLLAFERQVDDPSPRALEDLQRHLDLASESEKITAKYIADKMKEVKEISSLAQAALNVKGVGPITVAYCLVYINLEIADTPSKVWAYAGLHVPAHKRYVKNQKGGGNKWLRTAVRNLADVQVKQRGPYRPVYDRKKAIRENSNKITETRVAGQKGVVRRPWSKVQPGHRHDDALRAIMKHFLADYWFVGRTLFGLSTVPLYPEAILEDDHKIISPDTRGWVW
jgi:hypothetical protein